MTALANRLLTEALAQESLRPMARDALPSYVVPISEPQPQANNQLAA